MATYPDSEFDRIYNDLLNNYASTAPYPTSNQYPTSTPYPTYDPYPTSTPYPTSNPYPESMTLEDYQKLYSNVLAGMSNDDALKANIEAALRPMFDQSVEQLRQQRIANNAAIDVDAASRGMGNSTWVTDAKLRQMRNAESNLAALNANYNNQLYSALLQAQQDRDNKAGDLALMLFNQGNQDRLNAWNAQREDALNAWQAENQNRLNAWQVGREDTLNAWNAANQDRLNAWNAEREDNLNAWKAQNENLQNAFSQALTLWQLQNEQNQAGSGAPQQPSNVPVLDEEEDNKKDDTSNKPPKTIMAPYVPSYAYRPTQATTTKPNKTGFGRFNSINVVKE